MLFYIGSNFWPYYSPYIGSMSFLPPRNIDHGSLQVNSNKSSKQEGPSSTGRPLYDFPAWGQGESPAALNKGREKVEAMGEQRWCVPTCHPSFQKKLRSFDPLGSLTLRRFQGPQSPKPQLVERRACCTWQSSPGRRRSEWGAHAGHILLHGFPRHPPERGTSLMSHIASVEGSTDCAGMQWIPHSSSLRVPVKHPYRAAPPKSCVAVAPLASAKIEVLKKALAATCVEKYRQERVHMYVLCMHACRYRRALYICL